jgi:adenylylsulfate kinase/chloramphenicol 3-O phosphotransferase
LKNGGIIYLNGVTSTGKTSIGQAIQNIADRNIYIFSNDIFADLASRKFIVRNFWYYLGDAILNMYYAAAAMAKNGTVVIIDGMLTNEPELIKRFGKSHYETIKSCFNDIEVCLVEVYCPLEECRKRNIKRGDRGEYQSHTQSEYMQKDIHHNFRVDTLKNSPEQCAKQILENLQIASGN